MSIRNWFNRLTVPQQTFIVAVLVVLIFVLIWLFNEATL